MKLIKKDYPFTIIIEDKLSKKGTMYQSISIGYISIKNKEATDPKEKYNTDWVRFFDEKDLLKLSSLCENTYRDLKDAKQKKPAKQETQNSYPDMDDGIPF